MKNILIFGATGRTGKNLINQGLAQGYDITAFVRDPHRLQIQNKHLDILTGSISNPSQVSKAINEQDVIISVLGNKTSQALGKTITTISEATKNILKGMLKKKVKRLIFVTSFGVSDNIFFPEKLFIRLVLRNIFADIPNQEKLIKESGLEWTIVRPARLTNGAGIGSYKAKENLPINLFSHISRSDVADFLLKCVTNKQTIGKTITISY